MNSKQKHDLAYGLKYVLEVGSGFKDLDVGDSDSKLDPHISI